MVERQPSKLNVVGSRPSTRSNFYGNNMVEKKKAAAIINIVTIVLLLGILVPVFMALQHTAESNELTTRVALIQSKEESRIIKEMRLLTLELRNLQKDMDVIRTKVDRLKTDGDERGSR